MSVLLDLICCSLEPWDDVWRRNQFFVRELVRADPRCRVLFVEPPYDVLHRLATGHAATPRRAAVRAVAGQERVWALRPVKAAPRIAGGFADRHLARQVERAATALGFGAPVLWVNDAAYVTLAQRHRWPTVYDITDDWLAADAAPREHARRVAREAALLARADEVVVCSPALAASRGAQRPVRLVPNGVDLAGYASGAPRPRDLPEGPTALYVGTLHRDRLDVALVLDTARALADATFVFVGPNALSADDTRTLAAAPNVALLGPRPSPDVARYLTHATALIVPHVRNAFTESLDPIKAYEYLAARRPIVSTDVAGFRDLALEQVTAVSRDRFADALRVALADDRSFAPPPLVDWAARAAEFRAAIDAAVTAPRRAMRVTYLGHSAQLSGAELALARLLPQLTDVEPEVVLAEDGPLVARLTREGVATRVLALPERTRSLGRAGGVSLRAAFDTARYVVRLRSHLRHTRPDAVHTNSMKATVYGTLAARLAGLPVIVHVRDRIARDYLPRRRAGVIRAVVRVASTAWVANSAATAATVGGKKGRVIHDLVVPPAARRKHQRAGIASVGIIGRLAPWKGQHVFLDAFAQTFAGTAARADIIGAALFGEDDYVERLHHDALRLGIAGQVRFVGFVEDVFAALGELDVVVHASTLPEPFGQVIVEAMAAGVPVVATAGGGPSEILRDNVTGLLVPPCDAGALAAALARLRDESGLRERLASAAAADVARFSPDHIAAQYRRLYADVVSR